MPARRSWPAIGVVSGLLALVLVTGLTASGKTRTAGSGTASQAVPAAPTVEPSGRPSVGSSPTAAQPEKARPASTGAAKARPAKPAEPRIPSAGPRNYWPAMVSAQEQSRRGNLLTYSVRVERGLPYDAKDTARFIHQVLNDKRSWGRSGDWRLRLVSPRREADVEIFLVTRKTTDALCAPLQTHGKVSCYNEGRVVLNADRWAYGAKSYGDRLTDYRRNVVNHEVGHALGLGHVGCPGKGKRAPIMMQQTKGLHGCRANPWPYPGRG